MNEERYFGLAPAQLNLAFVGVVAVLAVGGVFAAGGPNQALDEAKEVVGLDEPKAEYAVGIEASPTPGGEPEIGPEVVWDALTAWLEQIGSTSADVALQNELSACDWDRECTASVMANYGARPQAVAFHKETGLFAVTFQEAGKVDVVGTFDIRRANSNDDTALVNGSPRILVVGGIDTSSMVEHPSYAEIASKVNDFAVWSSDSWLEDIAASPSGGQAFVFGLLLTDGCHACVLGQEARVAYDFSPDGTYQGWRALEPVGNTTVTSNWQPPVETAAPAPTESLPSFNSDELRDSMLATCESWLTNEFSDPATHGSGIVPQATMLRAYCNFTVAVEDGYASIINFFCGVEVGTGGYGDSCAPQGALPASDERCRITHIVWWSEKDSGEIFVPATTSNRCSGQIFARAGL